jgi:hypothetical protein
MTCARQRAHTYRRPVGGCIGGSSRTPKTRRSRTKSTGRVSNAILTAHSALRPADRPAIWIPCGGAAPDWTWRLRPALRLLFFFFGKRLSTMRTARPDSGHVSSRPTGSLRRALNQRPVHRALNASVMSVFMRARGAAALRRRRLLSVSNRRSQVGTRVAVRFDVRSQTFHFSLVSEIHRKIEPGCHCADVS